MLQEHEDPVQQLTGTQLDFKHPFSCLSIAHALFNFGIDCNMDTLYTEKGEDIAKAVIQAFSTI